MEEAQASKHVFHIYHTLHATRLRMRLSSLYAATASRNTQNAAQKHADARTHCASALTNIDACLRSLGFDASLRASQKRQNVFLPWVSLLAQLQVKFAQMTNEDMLNSLKFDSVPSLDKVVSVLDTYKAVFILFICFLFFFLNSLVNIVCKG